MAHCLVHFSASAANRKTTVQWLCTSLNMRTESTDFLLSSDPTVDSYDTHMHPIVLFSELTSRSKIYPFVRNTILHYQSHPILIILCVKEFSKDLLEWLSPINDNHVFDSIHVMAEELDEFDVDLLDDIVNTIDEGNPNFNSARKLSLVPDDVVYSHPVDWTYPGCPEVEAELTTTLS